MTAREAIQAYAQWCLDAGKLIDIDEAGRMCMHGKNIDTLAGVCGIEWLCKDINVADRMEPVKARMRMERE